MTTTWLGFPFRVQGGRIATTTSDEAIRAKIIQLLFTAPGERVNQPEFGCGLRNLLFEPANEVLAAAVEFSIGQAMVRWLSDEISLDAVQVVTTGEQVLVQITYTLRQTQVRQGLRLRLD